MPFSPLSDQPPDPSADAVYLPGGYPELHGGTLANAAATWFWGTASLMQKESGTRCSGF